MEKTREIPRHEALDRCEGALVGLAVGNVLGLPFEGWMGREIRRQWPGGVISPLLSELSQPWDDDVAMAMELALHLAEGGGDVQPEAMFARYREWMKSNGRGAAAIVREVLDLGWRGTSASAAERVWRSRGGSAGDTADNSAIMRVAPIGVRFRCDLDRLLRNAVDDAKLTHWDPLCTWTAAATAVLVADMIEERVTPLETFLAAAGCPESTVKKILEEPPIDVESGGFDDPDMSHTLRTWKIALWASHGTDDFQRGLQRVIRSGGDTDTNGAVAGAVLGARFGAQAIPHAWKEPVSDLGVIEETARRLHRLGIPEG